MLFFLSVTFKFLCCLELVNNVRQRTSIHANNETILYHIHINHFVDLGEEQWAWLEQELKKPAEIRFIASSTQVIPNEKGMDEWGNFPRERQRLFELIERTKAKGVVLFSTDRLY